jgi:hypothetical protein
MRKRLKNLKHKSGHSENGAPRQMIDEAVYRGHRRVIAGSNPPRFDSEYDGWSWATRPRDQAISLRRGGLSGFSGP